jgi:hypothetical protein
MTCGFDFVHEIEVLANKRADTQTVNTHSRVSIAEENKMAKTRYGSRFRGLQRVYAGSFQ